MGSVSENPFLVNTVHSLQHIWETTPFFKQQLSKELKSFRPKHRLFIENGSYILKTVESSWELETVLRLRYRVFIEEMLGRKGLIRLDIDRFDLKCDHLSVWDKSTKACVGTYRVNSSNFNSEFYTSTEFVMDDFLALPGGKLELGRACIDQQSRSKLIIALLWKGCYQYATETNAKYLFGCSSLPIVNRWEAMSLSKWFADNGHVANHLNIRPLKHYRFPPHRFSLNNGLNAARELPPIPPLLRSYLKSGALVGEEPAFDKSFKCTDFLTILDLERINPSFHRKIS